MENEAEYLKNRDALIAELRDMHRVKLGTDYAIVHKYGATHLLASQVYLATIQTVATKNDICFTSSHTFY